jgi:hypothetical protein
MSGQETPGKYTAKCLISVLGAWCSCALLLVSCGKPRGPNSVTSGLVDAFVEADLEAAKAVTVPEQWGRLEALMLGRQPFTCQDGDWETTGIQAVCLDISDSEIECGLGYRCVSQTTPYCLAIDDIVAIKIGDSWIVDDWGTMREAPSYTYPCGMQ